MKTHFVPANAGLKLTARFSVNVLPPAVTSVADSEIAHWLFCNVPALPRSPDSHNEPASFVRYTRSVAGS